MTNAVAYLWWFLIVICTHQMYAALPSKCRTCGESECGYCTDATTRPGTNLPKNDCKRDRYSVCKYRDSTCQTAWGEQCYCSQNTPTPLPADWTYTGGSCKLYKGDMCENDVVVGPCNPAHKGKKCYYDCNGQCVYDFKEDNLDKIGYCGPVKDCNDPITCTRDLDVNFLHKDDATVKETLLCSDTGRDGIPCKDCIPCRHCENNENNKWSECYRIREKYPDGDKCAFNNPDICMAESLDEKEITYCFAYPTCPGHDKCVENKCSVCNPCPWYPRFEELFIQSSPGDYAGKACYWQCEDDGTSGKCIYDYKIKGSNFHYSRLCTIKKPTHNPTSSPTPSPTPTALKDCSIGPNDIGKTCKSNDDCPICMKCCGKRKICEMKNM